MFRKDHSICYVRGLMLLDSKAGGNSERRFVGTLVFSAAATPRADGALSTMPFYKNLDPKKGADRWTAVGPLRLRCAIRKSVPPKTLDTNLLLARWNIRKFGGTKFRRRSKEALFYLTEVISAFDLVAVHEVRANLGDFNRLMKLLGSWWRDLLTDVTLGRRGNDERLAALIRGKSRMP